MKGYYTFTRVWIKLILGDSETERERHRKIQRERERARDLCVRTPYLYPQVISPYTLFPSTFLLLAQMPPQ